MWMMGCASNNMINDSSSLINQTPKPPPKTPPIIFNHHLLTFNQHLADKYKRDAESQHQLYASAKTRWNPTAAQLHALENIYRHGTRTPSSEQIQHIANQLRQYGEIEGKNVFYWFQNHKARERQKRRRVSESSSTKNCLVNVMEDQQAEADDTLDSEFRRTSLEVGQTNNNWSLPNSNFTTHSEEPVLIHREAAVVVLKSKSADGWIELENRESPERRKHVREKINMEEKKSIRRNFVTSSNYHEVSESQTLELFPLRSDDGLNCVRENHSHSITTFTTPVQFFEFL